MKLGDSTCRYCGRSISKWSESPEWIHNTDESKPVSNTNYWSVRCDYTQPYPSAPRACPIED